MHLFFCKIFDLRRFIVQNDKVIYFSLKTHQNANKWGLWGLYTYVCTYYVRAYVRDNIVKYKNKWYMQIFKQENEEKVKIVKCTLQNEEN